jgi:hypothetical protein
LWIFELQVLKTSGCAAFCSLAALGLFDKLLVLNHRNKLQVHSFAKVFVG